MSNNTNTNVGNNNSVLGSWALYSAANDTSCNSAFGTNSLLKHTTGSFNTSIGAGAMTSNITGERNVAVGSSALEQNAKSENNTAIGTQALFGQRDGSNNTAIGINAGLNDVSGSFNTYLGANTGTETSATPYTNSTAIGCGATINRSNRIVIGTADEEVYIPGNLNLRGTTNISGGGGGGPSTSLNSEFSSNNTIVGSNQNFSQYTNSTGLGYGANITSSKQIVLGTSAEFVCIPSNKGLSIGKITAPANGIGLDISGSISVLGEYKSDVKGNTKIGTNSLLANTTGMNNIAVGVNSLSANTTNNNIGIGAATLYRNTTGTSNIAVGTASLTSNTTGSYNIGIGSTSLYKNTIGSSNIAFGGGSLDSNTTGASNIAFGGGSLASNSTSANNTAIGDGAGKSKDMSGNNTFVGANADISGNATNIQNSTAIGSNAKVDASNQIVLGTSGEFVCIPTNRGLSIGKITAPANGIGLDVSGSVAINTGFMNYNKDLVNISLFSNIPGNNGYDINKGSGNIGIGPLSLSSFTTPGVTGNIAIGGRSMMNTTDGIYNVSIGGESMRDNKTGLSNTSIGTISMKNQIDGSYNTAIGQASMEFGIRNNYNTSIGCSSGVNDISGSCNTYLGVYSGTDTLLNIYNNSTAIGYQAKIDASNQIVLGTSQEFVCIPSYRGLSIGKTTKPLCAGLDINGSLIVSGDYISDVSGNTKIGTLSLSRTIHGINNVAVGFLSLNNNTNGDENVAVGVESLKLNYSGDGNVALGCKSLFTNTTSGNNVAIGYGAGSSKDMSGNNTFVGSNADIWVGATDNIQNSTAIGSNAKIDASNQIVLGTSNERVNIPGKLFVKGTEITGSGGGGTSTGAISDASNNTLLGTNTGRSNASISIVNSTAIGYNAKVDASNQIVLGTSGEFVCIPSKRGLSVGKSTKPNSNSILDVNGSSIVSGNLTIRGTYYGDSLNNVKIGGVSAKTNTGLQPASSISTPWPDTNPETNVSLIIDDKNNILLINNGDNIYTGGFFLTTDSTTGFNGVSTGSFGFSWGKNTNTTPTRPNDINFTQSGGVYVGGESYPYYIGFSPDVKAYGYISTGTSDTGLTTRTYSGSTLSIIGESLYKHNSLGQTITLYMAIGTSYNGNYSVTTPSGLSASAQTNYIYSLAGVILQPISTLVISSGVRSFNSINSTYLGANIKYLSDIDTSTSTAIGYGANIDVSNQIVLGTSGEFVCIPSNRGLSVGKSTAPNCALDISGSISVSGNYKSDANSNIKIGTDSLVTNESGSNNVAIGTESLKLNVSSSNVAIGSMSLTNNRGGYGNIALGTKSLYTNIGGGYNIAIGEESLYTNTSGYRNIALGYQSLYYNAGIYNIAIGENLTSNTDGNYNIAIGLSSLNLNTKSIRNVALGDGAGKSKDMSGNNTFIGAFTDISGNATNITNSTALGYNATIDTSNQIVLGTTNEFVCIPSSSNNKGLSIGKRTAPATGYVLDVVGSIKTTGSVNASGSNLTSDYRIKDNVRNLDEQDTISNLRPVKYFNKQTNKNDFGLIAHELQSEYPDLVFGEKDGQELQSVNYIGLISVLIKEVQELKQITAEQAKEIAELKSINL